MINLDYLAAKYGQPIGIAGEMEESAITTALNILHEQGIYAMFLWLYEAPEKRGLIGARIQDLFKDNQAPVRLKDDKRIWNTEEVSQSLDNVRKVFTENLKTMFLAKDLISLTLTYARHAAKVGSEAYLAPPNLD